MEITGLLIAAGLSKRMGCNKALLTYNNLTFTVGIIIKLLKICKNVKVVLGYESGIVEEKILSELNSFNIPQDRIEIVRNDNYCEGMFTSLQAGIKSIDKPEWVIYHFVDQPQIPDEFYEYFATQIESEYDWIQPVYEGRKGHPVLFSAKICKKIASASPKQNLKQIMHSEPYKKKYVVCETSSIIHDIDYAEDYNSFLS
jgi:molybdenum cofactor cytidylyltransferase